MSVHELKQALKDITGSDHLTVSYAHNGNQIITIGDKSLEVGPMASSDEIRQALQNPFVRTESTRMSISGYQHGSIRDRLNQLKAKANDARAQALAKIDAAGQKHDIVNAEIEKVAKQIEKEADDALQEFAQFTNGAPE